MTAPDLGDGSSSIGSSEAGDESEASTRVVAPAPSCKDIETSSSAASTSSDGNNVGNEPPQKRLRCKEGHRRPNGRWEARHRPKSPVKLDHSYPEIASAYRGFDPRTKLHKYEWLQYFDSKKEKDEFIKAKRDLFKNAKKTAVTASKVHDGFETILAPNLESTSPVSPQMYLHSSHHAVVPQPMSQPHPSLLPHDASSTHNYHAANHVVALAHRHSSALALAHHASVVDHEFPAARSSEPHPHAVDAGELTGRMPPARHRYPVANGDTTVNHRYCVTSLDSSTIVPPCISRSSSSDRPHQSDHVYLSHHDRFPHRRMYDGIHLDECNNPRRFVCSERPTWPPFEYPSFGGYHHEHVVPSPFCTSHTNGAYSPPFHEGPAESLLPQAAPHFAEHHRQPRQRFDKIGPSRALPYYWNGAEPPTRPRPCTEHDSSVRPVRAQLVAGYPSELRVDVRAPLSPALRSSFQNLAVDTCAQDRSIIKITPDSALRSLPRARGAPPELSHPERRVNCDDNVALPKKDDVTRSAVNEEESPTDDRPQASGVAKILARMRQTSRHFLSYEET